VHEPRHRHGIRLPGGSEDVGLLRVDLHLVVGGQPVTVFGGVQKVTNRRNVPGYTWDRRSNVPRVNEQQGLFPILGLEWDF
jgi:hypothetical protein